MWNRVFAIFLVVITFCGILSLAYSSLANFTIISSTGEIATNKVIAQSGSAIDIQAAVNAVASRGGGDVYIPTGTWNFVPNGYWSSNGAPVVTVPAGVSIFGSPNQRFANGSNDGWNTVLQVTWEVPDQNALGGPWFFFQGSGDPNKPSRFSDVKMVGYRYFNLSSTVGGPEGIIINEVMNYRVDHVYFRDVTGGAIWAGWYDPNTNNLGDHRTHTNGLIDHNLFINTNGVPGPNENQATVGYGIQLGRTHSTYWDDNISNVAGHYTNYTTFIEDNYFEKWRHCVSSNDGYHYVFRHNKIDADFGFGSIDQHGTYNAVGTRAVEVYDNTFTNCLSGYNHEVNRLRGGAGIFFNNTVDSSYYLFVGTSYDLTTPTKALVGYMPDNPLYIWNNNLASGVAVNSFGSYIPLVQSQNLFYSAMPNYTPYPYPFPLTPQGFPNP